MCAYPQVHVHLHVHVFWAGRKGVLEWYRETSSPTTKKNENLATVFRQGIGHELCCVCVCVCVCAFCCLMLSKLKSAEISCLLSAESKIFWVTPLSLERKKSVCWIVKSAFSFVQYPLTLCSSEMSVFWRGIVIIWFMWILIWKNVFCVVLVNTFTGVYCWYQKCYMKLWRFNVSCCENTVMSHILSNI